MATNEQRQAFLKELKELLHKYKADIYVENDGDTHGLLTYICIDIDNKEVFRRADGCLSAYDIN